MKIVLFDGLGLPKSNNFKQIIQITLTFVKTIHFTTHNLIFFTTHSLNFKETLIRTPLMGQIRRYDVVGWMYRGR